MVLMSANENTVELIGTYGGDETHALSAWTSTSRDLSEEKRRRIPQLLKMLASEGHHTPFEKSMLHFLVRTDIATHIHLLKHRIGVSVNAESARYRELTGDNYVIPHDWPNEEVAVYEEHVRESMKRYHEALDRLTRSGVSRKRAKETARLYLPYGSQVTADVSFNFRSFQHFLRLRYSMHAQEEVRDVARKMLASIASLTSFRHTLEAFQLLDERGEPRDPFDSER